VNGYIGAIDNGMKISETNAVLKGSCLLNLNSSISSEPFFIKTLPLHIKDVINCNNEWQIVLFYLCFILFQVAPLLHHEKWGVFVSAYPINSNVQIPN